MKKYSPLLLTLAKRHIIKRRQFIIYALIGISGVTIDYLAYVLGVELFGIGVITANFISISLGIINNFILNTKYNFKVHDRLWTRFGLFYAVGFLGLIFSDVLLVLFHYGLHLNPLIAKLLTLPFVLVGQYFLNKHISFGSIDQAAQVGKRLLRHWPGYIVASVFLCSSLMFINHIPANFKLSTPAYAPDESTHYIFNVEFILRNKRLPVSGKDDLAAYTNCRNNPTSQVPCLYSYTFYPGPSYIINAASASVFSKVYHLTPIQAARIPSMFYGLIFVLCAYFAAYIITGRRLIATWLAAGVGLIPQFIFTSSYTNLDAHSIGISGLIGLALVLFLDKPEQRWRLPFLAVVTGGLLPLAKYNFFILAPAIVVLVAYAYVKKRITPRQLWQGIAWVCGGFIVIAGFWYARQLLLYHDLFGQSFALHEMTKYHPLGTPMLLNRHSLAILTDMNFFNILFRSFYLCFGGMFYYLEEYKYLVPAALGVYGAVLLFSRLAEARRKLGLLIVATVGFLIIVVGTVGEVIYNAMEYDFQPQGRYLFPILMPLVIFLAYCARKDKKLEKLTFLFAAGTLFIFINAIELFIKVYIAI